MGAGVERIHEKIRSFKKKYYLNIFIRGALFSLSILFSYFLIAALLEYNLWLGPWARFFIFLSLFCHRSSFACIRFLKEPIQWWFAKRGLNEEQSAKVIGDYLPTVKDRCLILFNYPHSEIILRLRMPVLNKNHTSLNPFHLMVLLT